jgi:hypothetical protein
MKRTNNNLFNRLSCSTLENLTREVRESLDVELQVIKQPVFTAADLWNIQRQGRTRTSRRFL